MNPLLRVIYEGATRLARAAAWAAPASSRGKALRSVRARRGIRARYAQWGSAARDGSRELLWVHAPSVGEGLQASPVLQRVREQHPDLQIAYTYFSPSAEIFARSLDVDFADYLPFDTAADARHVLAALRPSALVFSKLDVWPTLVRESARHGVRLGLISATLAPSSARRSRLAAALLREAYALLDAVGAIDERDAARLTELGVRETVISITGDTRYDQVWARAQGVDRESTMLDSLRSARPTLVAGSTWSADERVLLEAWRPVRRAIPEARLIIAPHEPTPAHLATVERWAAEASLRLARLDAPDATDADVVLVDRVGVLADLYALANVAFVGGGFHAAGLHSVLEPAAFGVPVLFGPRHQGSRDAGLLIAAAGGAAVASAPALADHLALWLTADRERRDTGARAQRVLIAGLGAAERSAALVRRLLEG